MARERRRHRDRGDERGQDLHGQILEMLLDKVREDLYPSTTHLDLIEQMLREDEVEEYASILLDKVSGENYPSLDYLRRLQNYA
jgi:hypothetical protein